MFVLYVPNEFLFETYTHVCTLDIAKNKNSPTSLANTLAIPHFKFVIFKRILSYFSYRKIKKETF